MYSVQSQRPNHEPIIDPVAPLNPRAEKADEYEEFDTIHNSRSSSSFKDSEESRNYQEMNQSNTAATSVCHDVSAPIYQNDQDTAVAAHFEDSQSECSSHRKAPLKPTQETPATMPIQSNICKMDKKDYGLSTNNSNRSIGTSQGTITRNGVRHRDRKSPDAHHSINSMKSKKQEYSVRPEVSMSPKYSPTAEPLQNDTPVATATAVAAETPIFTRYICIMDKMYKDLKAVENDSSDQSRLCCIPSCSELQRIENESDLHAYVKHLMHAHPCLIDEEITNAEELLQHRLENHKWEPLVGLHIEEFESMQVYKIVRYQNQTKEEQSDRNPLIEESKVIVTDWKEPRRGTVISSDDVFMCKRHAITLELGTKEEALRHHYEKHSTEPFQCTLQRFKRTFFKSEVPEAPEHRAYLFECFYCKTLFASILSHNEHACEPGPKIYGPHFTAHRLVACHIDKTIQTFQQLKNHFTSEHPFHVYSGFSPVDIFDSGKCGLCNYANTHIDELQGHFALDHEKGEIVTNEFMASMGLLEFNIDECHFAPVCCPEFKTKGIEETIQRMCQRHFTCNKCKNIKFNMQTINLINHQDQVARKTHEEILEWVKKLKLVPTLFADMQITLPNGFTAPINNIEDPYFEADLQQKLNEKVIEISKIFQNQNGLQLKNFIYFSEKFVKKSRRNTK